MDGTNDSGGLPEPSGGTDERSSYEQYADFRTADEAVVVYDVDDPTAWIQSDAAVSRREAR